MAKRTTMTTRKEAPPEDESFDIDDTEGESPEKLTDNALDVPLFAGSDKRSLKSIAYIRLYKFEDKNWAYKGMIPTSSTYETIGQMYGDGLYNLEACNRKHLILDTQEQVRISLGTVDDEKQPALPHMERASNKEEMDRVERLATSAAADSKQIQTEFLKLFTTQTEAAASREREFMTTVQSSQAENYRAMLALQAQGFQQTMAMMQAANAMVISQLTAVNKKDKENEVSPLALAELLMKGINMGRELEMGAEDEEPEDMVGQILQGGFNLLSGAHKVMTKGQLPADTGAGKENPDKVMNKAKRRKVLNEALQLYKAVRSSGLTPAQLVDSLNAAKSASERPAPDDEPEEPETDDDDESDDDESDSFESEEPSGASPTN